MASLPKSVYEGTDLYRIEEKLNLICRGIYTFSLNSVSPRSALAAGKKMLAGGAYPKPIGIWAKNHLDGDKAVGIDPASISTWFTEGGKFAPSLKASWNTPTDLIMQIAGAAKEWAALCKKADVDRSSRNSEASNAIVDPEDMKTKEYPLYANWNTSDEKLTAPDEEFLYSRLRKDSTGNLYWVFNSGNVVPIPLSEGSAARKILDDSSFWSEFAKDNMSRIAEYSRLIVDRCYELRDSRMIDEKNTVPTLEEELENLVPHCISRNIAVQIYMVKVGEGKTARWVFHHFSLAMNAQNKSMNRTNWCSILQTDMLRFLNFDHIKKIAQWGTNGVDSIFRPAYVAEQCPCGSMPMLPGAFRQFFSGKLINPLMGLLRIATFVNSVIDPGNYSRQSLVLVGLGKEGKGIFCRFLEGLFGNACVTLQENAFDRENRFGMGPAINRRLIILQDVKQPSSVIESPMFKSVTGNDTLSIDRKFQMPMEWKVEGTKVVIVTNKKIWLNNQYAVSRILPVFFMKNYKDTDALSVPELTAALMAEMKPFVQWCADYENYFRDLKNKAGENFPYCTKNGLSILSDDSFKAWMRGELTGTPNEITREAFENESPGDMPEPMFKIRLYDDEDEDQSAAFSDIFNRFFKRSELGIVPSQKISEALIEGSKSEFPSMIIAGITKQTCQSGKCQPIKDFKAWLIAKGFKKVKLHGDYVFRGMELRDASEPIDFIGGAPC